MATKANEDLFSLSRLQRITGLDRRTLSKRLANVEPAGENRGNATYLLKDCWKEIFLNGGSGSSHDPDKMEPSERDKWFASELKRRDMLVRDGQLLEVEEVTETVSTALSALAQSIFSLPDLLERKAGLDTEQAELCQNVIHELMDDLADRLKNMAVKD